MGGAPLNITADTNVLVRAVVRDDAQQARAAARVLKQADVIAIASPALCEFVWVLRKVYGLAAADIAEAVQALLDTAPVVVNRPAAEAGLAVLKAGSDFADGVIAHEGSLLGGETFVSFDRRVVDLLTGLRRAAKLL